MHTVLDSIWQAGKMDRVVIIGCDGIWKSTLPTICTHVCTHTDTHTRTQETEIPELVKENGEEGSK